MQQDHPITFDPDYGKSDAKMREECGAPSFIDLDAYMDNLSIDAKADEISCLGEERMADIFDVIRTKDLDRLANLCDELYRKVKPDYEYQCATGHRSVIDE